MKIYKIKKKTEKKAKDEEEVEVEENTYIQTLKHYVLWS